MVFRVSTSTSVPDARERILATAAAISDLQNHGPNTVVDRGSSFQAGFMPLTKQLRQPAKAGLTGVPSGSRIPETGKARGIGRAPINGD